MQLDPNLFVASQRTAIAGSAWPTDAPHAFHLLAKPSGSTCNIDCSYCFFLSKEALYPDQRQHMSDGTLETYIRQLLESHQAPKVQVAWQGGEPTLMQLAFFQRAVELVERHRRPGQIIEHSIQTNGTLLDDDWCRFFKQHRFLVGLSVDGPRELHDRYRVDRLGHGTFSRVLQGWRHLRRHGVEFNILCTIHAANQQHGRATYQDQAATDGCDRDGVVRASLGEVIVVVDGGRRWRLGGDRLRGRWVIRRGRRPGQIQCSAGCHSRPYD